MVHGQSNAHFLRIVDPRRYRFLCQQKTIILLMYLSQCKYLSEVKFKQPILFLDEVCSHLDDVNRNVLLTLIESFKLQIFMTGTSKNLFSFLSTKANFCNITV